MSKPIPKSKPSSKSKPSPEPKSTLTKLPCGASSDDHSSGDFSHDDFSLKWWQPFEAKLNAWLGSAVTTDAAHDKAHILRVVATAKQLAQAEQALLAVVLPAAYLHDCVTLAKNHPDRAMSSKLAAEKAIEILTEIQYPSVYYAAIAHAIEAHSYSAGIAPETLEAQIVQDADRLDALGAIGIARCIQVSTSFDAELYHADDPFAQQRPLDDKRYAIDHFEIKLFPIAKTMNCAAASREAADRVAFMRAFLAQLDHEVSQTT